MEKIQLLRRKDFGMLLNDSIEFSRQNFIPYSKAFLYITAPPLLVAMILLTVIFSLMHSGPSQQAVPIGSFTNMVEYNKNIIATTLPHTLIIALFASIIGILQGLLSYQYILLYERKESPAEITVAELWAAVKSNAGNMVGSYLAFAFIFIVYAAVCIGVVVGLAFISKALAFVAGMALFVVSFYFIIAATSFFMVRFREGLGIFECLGRCVRLMRGRWWRSFGVIMLAGLIIGVVQMICIAPLSAFTGIDSYRRVMQGMAPATYGPMYGITQALSLAVTSYLSAFGIFAVGINYYALTEEKDNTRLLQDIEGIGERRDTHNTQQGDY